MIRTIAVTAFIVLGLIFILPWFLLWGVLARDPAPMYFAAMRAARMAARIGGMRVRVEGIENIPPETCIFVANHASNVDPLAFIPAIPRRVSILVKRELFRIPILAAGMRQAQFVPVYRADRESAAASVDEAIHRLRQGLSFAIFPEGTRSPDGRLRPFKKGAFIMAILAGVPIVPVSISGTQKILQRGRRMLRPGEVTVSFGAAIPSAAYTMERRGELLARAESAVAETLSGDQQPSRAIAAG